jgi:TonB family protein
VRFCYERALQRRPELRGRVVTRFTIGDDGRVTRAAIADSSVADADVGACVAAAERRWRFPAPCAGDMRYPFVFERADALLADAPDDAAVSAP